MHTIDTAINTRADLFMSGTHVRYETWFGHTRHGVLTGKYIDRPTERFWEIAPETVDVQPPLSVWISDREFAVIYDD